MNITTAHQKVLINKLIFIDGMTRTGKTLLAKTIPTLKNFEQVEYAEFMELILAGNSLGKISSDFSRSLIVTLLNELAYNKLIGRKANFRNADITSVRRFKNKRIYEERLKLSEGSKVISKLKNNKNFFLFMTHDIMVNYNFFKKIKLKHKMIQLYRNPFDIIYSWYKRGLGFRFGDDPSIFTTLIKYQNKLCPWFVANYANKWIKKNEVEKCSLITLDLIKRSIQNQKKIKNKNNLLTISYENFVQNTETEMSKICNFLGTVKTPHTKEKLLKEKCPKFIDPFIQRKKELFIKSSIPLKLYEQLFDLSKNFKKNTYNLI